MPRHLPPSSDEDNDNLSDVEVLTSKATTRKKTHENALNLHGSESDDEAEGALDNDHQVDSSSPLRPMTNTDKRPRADSVGLPPDESVAPANKKAKGAIPEFRDGVTVDPRNPKASDYKDTVTAIIIRAASEYECLISTEDAFPDTAQRNKWARKVWKHACAAAKENYDITDAISKLIRERSSRIRGHTVTKVRHLVSSVFGFKRNSDAKAIAANCALVAKLRTDSAFHYKDPDTMTGFMQGKIICDILQEVWFDGKDSQGVVFEKLFNPIPFETLALIMTTIHFCLGEWVTGTRIKATFWEKNVIDQHKSFQLDLKNWDSLNTFAIEGIRKKYYLRASCSVVNEKHAPTQPTLTGAALDQACKELEGRSGETDSEDEEPRAGGGSNEQDE